MFKPPQLFSRQ